MICFVRFRNGHFQNVDSMFINVVKLDVGCDNVVSTFSNVHIKVEIHNIDSMLIDVANSNVEIHNVVSTMLHVPTSYQPKDNVETT